MGAICSTTVPVGTRLHWSTDSPACMGRLRQDGQCCGREAQCGWRTKINWTKTAHNTRTSHMQLCICICGHLGLVPIQTHKHIPLCGYGLSTGPTDGLSSWWLRNRSPPNSQQQQQQRRHMHMLQIMNVLPIAIKLMHIRRLPIQYSHCSLM